MPDKESKTQKSFEYYELERFLINELGKLQYGELSAFCRENNLSINEVSRLRAGKIKNQRPYFLANILKGLGYKKVRIRHQIIFDVSKDSIIK